MSLAPLDLELRRLEPPPGDPAPPLSPLERARLGARISERLAEVATNPPDPAWRADSATLHPRLREALARNPHLPAEWILPLARTPDGLAHAALAARGDLAVDVLLALLDSPEPTVRSRVLAEHADPALTRAAIRHRDPWLRAAVAARDDIDAETLTALAADADVRVRRRIAENPITPQRVLMRLGRDEDPGVRRAARAHPSWAPAWWERWWRP